MGDLLGQIGWAGQLIAGEKQPRGAVSLKQKLAQQPVSPAGAKAAGATPDSAKMFGTPAQKSTIAKAAVDGGRKTLQEAQRYDIKQQVAPSQNAADKLATMKSLGGIQSQLQTMIETKFSGLQAASSKALQVDQEAVELQQLEQEKEIKTKTDS